VVVPARPDLVVVPADPSEPFDCVEVVFAPAVDVFFDGDWPADPAERESEGDESDG
jgi:hypothetical protein